MVKFTIKDKLTIEEWFEKLVLNVLPYEQWTNYSKEECAYLVFQRYIRSPERSWGWSWGSWLSTIFDGDEFYDSLSYEEKLRLDEELLNYVKELAMKVSETRREELKKLYY
ncbi:TPA: hypothetical protein [Aquificae Conch Spring virus]|nr:TPA: hypothetical protein [Aquificae Conch Spring virus]